MLIIKRTYTFYSLLRSMLVLLLVTTFTSSFAQDESVKYLYDEGNVRVQFNSDADSLKLNRELKRINCSLAIVDSLNKLTGPKVSESGWELTEYNEDIIEFKKTINSLSSSGKNEHIFIDDNISIDQSIYNLDVKYGINKLKKEGVIKEKEENLFTFYLDGHSKTKQVYLSGTFNNWSTLGLPMTKEENGWSISVKLKKGKHLYKYIVDGKWIEDPQNALRESDGQGNTNSIFFNYNYTFSLRGYNDSKKVYLAGSFNGWDPDQLKMKKNMGPWEIRMYLEEGIHTYKFVVDGEWILDPYNRDRREDGLGNVNSFLSFGKTFTFKLKDFRNASKVILTGDFNYWNESELIMKREYGNWVLPIALKPGNYGYKYIVDGRWKNDPSNPHRNGFGDYENSVVSVGANHTFILEGPQNAKQVLLSGTFNGWTEEGYTMKKIDGTWQIKVFLPEGKSRYKFIVDGEWIEDPKNPLYENNGTGSNDSIIWMK